MGKVIWTRRQAGIEVQVEAETIDEATHLMLDSVERIAEIALGGYAPPKEKRLRGHSDALTEEVGKEVLHKSRARYHAIRESIKNRGEP